MFAGHPIILAKNILEKQLDEVEATLETIFNSRVTIQGLVTSEDYLFQLSGSAKTVQIDDAVLEKLQDKNVTRKNLEVLLGFKDSVENIKKLADTLEFLRRYHESQSFTFDVNQQPKAYNIVKVRL